MAFDASQHRFGQHDRRPRRGRDPSEGNRHPAKGVESNVEHMPAVNVVLMAQRRETGVHALGCGDRQPGDLHDQTLLMLVRTQNHHDVVAEFVIDE